MTAVKNTATLTDIDTAEQENLIVITDAAANKVKELIVNEGNPNMKLRISIQGGGCSGWEYVFAFTEDVNDDDYKQIKNEVTLLVDSMSLSYLEGAEIDYQEDISGSQFTVRNPHATTTCGCGSSFSA